MAGLALQVLNESKNSKVLPSSDDGMDLGIRDAEISTGWVGAEVSLGWDRFLWATLGFDLIPGDDDMRPDGSKGSPSRIWAGT